MELSEIGPGQRDRIGELEFVLARNLELYAGSHGDPLIRDRAEYHRNLAIIAVRIYEEADKAKDFANTIPSKKNAEDLLTHLYDTVDKEINRAKELAASLIEFYNSNFKGRKRTEAAIRESRILKAGIKRFKDTITTYKSTKDFILEETSRLD